MYTGAQPVFVDVEPDTYNIDPTKIAEKITPRTKAIMPVHIYGHSCDMDPIIALAGERNIAIVEDAAEAHGATYRGRKCGALGNISAFSFYGNKIVTTGEGGMVCTNDDALAENARALQDLSHVPGHRFLHSRLGYNYRMTNLQAALGLGQLEYIEQFLETKKYMSEYYNRRLSNIPGLRLPITKNYAKNVFWMYAVLVEESFGMARDDLSAALKKRGIDTRDFFLPCHSQPAIIQKYPTQEIFPVTERIAHQGLYLPSGLAITEEQIERVCSAIREISQNQGKKV
jgi:perosamine synthetase